MTLPPMIHPVKMNLQRGIRAFPGLGLTPQADILVLDGVIGISVARGEKGELYQA